jgi:hypothetical protein
MVIGVWSLDWLSHNSQRAYPITADSTRQDKSKSFTIPNDFLLSMTFSVPWDVAQTPDQFFISRIVADSLGYQVTISQRAGGADHEAGVFLVPRLRHEENSVYRIAGLGGYQQGSGHVVIGSLVEIDKQPRGEFEFDLRDARLETDVIHPELRSIEALYVDYGGTLSPPLSGRVRLIPGRNVRFTVLQEPGELPTLVIDAISGEGLNQECVCEDAPGPPVRVINGARPINGRIDLIGTDCAVIEGGTHHITFKDTCAKPCCGCAELEAITKTLEDIGNRIATWENFMTQLDARVTQMDMTVLGSRLGDRGCVPEKPCP